jgi:hypothetical protein
MSKDNSKEIIQNLITKARQVILELESQLKENRSRQEIQDALDKSYITSTYACRCLQCDEVLPVPTVDDGHCNANFLGDVEILCNSITIISTCKQCGSIHLFSFKPDVVSIGGEVYTPCEALPEDVDQLEPDGENSNVEIEYYARKIDDPDILADAQFTIKEYPPRTSRYCGQYYVQAFSKTTKNSIGYLWNDGTIRGGTGVLCSAGAVMDDPPGYFSTEDEAAKAIIHFEKLQSERN